MESLRKAFLFVSFYGTAIAEASPPPNDSFCSPDDLGLLPLGGQLIKTGASTVDATTEPSEPFPPVGWIDGSVDNSVWYKFEISGSTCVSILYDSTSGSPDQQYALYDSGVICPSPSFNLVAADDDNGGGFQPLLKGVSVADGIYYLQVDGSNGDQGVGTITVQDCEPPPNDNFCDATSVGTISGDTDVVFPFTNVDATPEIDEPTPGAGTGTISCESQDGWCGFETNIQNSVWFQFDVDLTDCVEILWDYQIDWSENIASFPPPNAPDLQFALYEFGNCTSPNWQLVAANDDSGPNFVPYIEDALVEDGKTYLLQVDGFAGTEATGDIRIRECSDDSDGDGVPNVDDICPYSDVDEPFHVRDCFPDVSFANNINSIGCTPSQDLARFCLLDSQHKNPAGKLAQGGAHACVNKLTTTWVNKGIIHQSDKGKIQSCVRDACVATCSANDS